MKLMTQDAKRPLYGYSIPEFGVGQSKGEVCSEHKSLTFPSECQALKPRAANASGGDGRKLLDPLRLLRLYVLFVLCPDSYLSFGGKQLVRTFGSFFLDI